MTSLDQLTDKGRSRYVKGKKAVEAMYEVDMKSGGYNDVKGNFVRGRENPYELVRNGGRPLLDQTLARGEEDVIEGGSDSSDNFIGFRQHAGGHMKSMSAGLAKDLASSLVRPQYKKHITQAPFATNDSLPTDPYMSAMGGRSKELFLENYKPTNNIPGYTGVGRR